MAHLPSVHVFLSNAGGTGKTFNAALLADTLQSQGRKVRCIDADPACGSLSHYSGGLEVKRLPWSNKDYEVAQRAFAEVFRPASEEEIRILDCGPAAFLPFCRFIEKAKLGERRKWWLHLPIWENRLPSAAYGFQFLRPAMPLPLVLWLTDFRKRETAQELALTELPIRAEEVAAWVNVPTDPELHRSVFQDYTTLSRVIADRSDLLRAHRGQMFLERWTPEATFFLAMCA